MKVEFTGKVLQALPLKTGMGQRGPWARATVIFEVQDGQYTQKIACENKNQAEKFSKLQPGQSVSVKADVNCREYNGNYYTSLVCYDFSVQDGDLPPV